MIHSHLVILTMVHYVLSLPIFISVYMSMWSTIAICARSDKKAGGSAFGAIDGKVMINDAYQHQHVHLISLFVAAL
jgi:hypothetical protein